MSSRTNRDEPTSRTYDSGYVDYRGMIKKVHEKNVQMVQLSTMEQKAQMANYLLYVNSKPLANPIPNVLNLKVGRAWKNAYEEGCSPLRPINNHYPLPENDVLKQKHIPFISH